eukprot:scaffold137395_cov42-Cyclotella_meneghiniana.AAC.1
MASTITTGDDSSPNTKLFQSLQPYSLTTDAHSMAIEKLYEHYKHIFVFPKCRYIQQYFHNKRIREMKSLEKAFSSEQVASETAQHMVKAADHDENSGTPDPLINTVINDRVDVVTRKRSAKQEAKMLTRIEELEAKLNESIGKVQQAERVIYNLSTELHQVKGVMPAPAPGSQTIELLDDSPVKPPAKKVRVNLPQQESTVRPEPPRGENPFKRKKPRRGKRWGSDQVDDVGPGSSLNNDYRHQEWRHVHQHKQRKKKRHEKERQPNTKRP